MKKFQKKHYGIEIPEFQQPHCEGCGGGMALNISYPQNKCEAFWWCLNDSCLHKRQLSFDDWLNQYPVDKNIRQHFSFVGIPHSKLLEASLIEAGYTLMGVIDGVAGSMVNQQARNFGLAIRASQWNIGYLQAKKTLKDLKGGNNYEKIKL